MSWLRAGLSYAGGSELDGTDWRSVKVTFRGLERLHPVRLDLIAIPSIPRFVALTACESSAMTSTTGAELGHLPLL
jgi:hypothetical protein